MLLATVFEIKVNGLEQIIDNLKQIKQAEEETENG